MYYLLRPGQQSLLWTDISDSLMNGIAKRNGLNVADLRWDNVEWQQADRPFDLHTLRFALRYGIPLSQGIAVGGLDLVPLTHLEQLLSIKMRRQRDLPAGDLMEHLMPGWTAHGDEMDDRIEQDVLRSREEARREVEQALRLEPKPELIAHWGSFGGYLPDPA
jgi:hypothetical protein